MELEKKYSCLTKNRLVINRSVNVDKNYQETLEAYLEDLHRVIRCECHSYVTSCDIVDSTAVVEGKSEICLTYTNADGEYSVHPAQSDRGERDNARGRDAYFVDLAATCQAQRQECRK